MKTGEQSDTKMNNDAKGRTNFKKYKKNEKR